VPPNIQLTNSVYLHQDAIKYAIHGNQKLRQDMPSMTEACCHVRQKHHQTLGDSWRAESPIKSCICRLVGEMREKEDGEERRRKHSVLDIESGDSSLMRNDVIQRAHLVAQTQNLEA